MKAGAVFGLVVAAAVLMASSLACCCGALGQPVQWPWERWQGWGPRQSVTGSGNVVEETRDVSGFSEINLAGVGDVFIEQGDAEGVRIEAEDNLIPYIITEVRGDQLYIGWEELVSINPTRPIKFYVEAKALNNLALAGLGRLEADRLETSRLEISLSGSGTVDIGTLDCDSLEVNISGMGDTEIGGGAVGSQEIRLSGSGNYRAADLSSDTADVRVSGLGSATIRVADRLTARISGAGSVEYYGDPTVSETVSGLGRVRKAGE